jgi:antitoxin component YwqK of YwqJK toxin-antitoxin module
MLENNDDFCGVVRTYHDKEKTKIFEEYFKMNGKIEGIYKSYWKNGQLCCEVNYIDDKREGIYKSYWDDGQLYKEVNYIDGKENGIRKLYFPNGQLWHEVNYIDGKIV